MPVHPVPGGGKVSRGRVHNHVHRDVGDAPDPEDHLLVEGGSHIGVHLMIVRDHVRRILGGVLGNSEFFFVFVFGGGGGERKDGARLSGKERESG